jgi:hypothetical protein
LTTKHGLYVGFDRLNLFSKKKPANLVVGTGKDFCIALNLFYPWKKTYLATEIEGAIYREFRYLFLGYCAKSAVNFQNLLLVLSLLSVISRLKPLLPTEKIKQHGELPLNNKQNKGGLTISNPVSFQYFLIA